MQLRLRLQIMKMMRISADADAVADIRSTSTVHTPIPLLKGTVTTQSGGYSCPNVLVILHFGVESRLITHATLNTNRTATHTRFMLPAIEINTRIGKITNSGIYALAIDVYMTTVHTLNSLGAENNRASENNPLKPVFQRFRWGAKRGLYKNFTRAVTPDLIYLRGNKNTFFYGFRPCPIYLDNKKI